MRCFLCNVTLAWCRLSGVRYASSNMMLFMDAHRQIQHEYGLSLGGSFNGQVICAFRWNDRLEDGVQDLADTDGGMRCR